jgi:hypothetical protein
MTHSETTHPPPSAAIACSLTPGGLAQRLAGIAELNGAFLRTYRQDGRVLELTYTRTALPQVREMIRREAECCSFLRFELAEEGDLVQARITAPNVPGSTAVLFAPFLVGTDAEGV